MRSATHTIASYAIFVTENPLSAIPLQSDAWDYCLFWHDRLLENVRKARH